MGSEKTSGRPLLIHCSYHKCLTVYFKRVMQMLFNRALPWGGGYKHYNSHLSDFLANVRSHRLASVNNRALDLESLAPFKITRFVRDPRDLLVSGYFYHRRGAEGWVTQPSPTEDDWYFAAATIPEAMAGKPCSYAEHLQSLSVEEGLLAELEVRRLHFESMRAWPDEHPDILTFPYETVLGREEEVFSAIFRHYGLSGPARSIGRLLARRYALKSGRVSDAHVRNPQAGQWKEHFTPRVEQVFEERYGDVLTKLGYDSAPA